MVIEQIILRSLVSIISALDTNAANMLQDSSQVSVVGSMYGR